MLRISKMTDYATLVLARLEHGAGTTSASEMASATGIGTATVSKLLKILSRAGLVISQRGSAGGYQLARPANEISAAQIIDAVEGPVSITACSDADHTCQLEPICGVGSAWQKINIAIRNSLDDISLADLLRSHSIPNTFSVTPIIDRRMSKGN